MNQIVLQKSGNKATINILSESDLIDVLALHDKTRASLPTDKKQFILPHSTSYFENLLAGSYGIMIGIKTEEGDLIAQLALMGPMTLSAAIDDQIITHNDVTFYHASLNDEVIVIKSLACHPDWRGNNLAKVLVDYVIQMSYTKDCNHLFAQISAANKISLNVFLSSGFCIVAAGYDPDDELPRFILQRPENGFEVKVDDLSKLTNDFPAIVRMTRDEAAILGRENLDDE
jgi:GNAT superfamily N-acetyltransferase